MITVSGHANYKESEPEEIIIYLDSYGYRNRNLTGLPLWNEELFDKWVERVRFDFNYMWFDTVVRKTYNQYSSYHFQCASLELAGKIEGLLIKLWDEFSLEVTNKYVKDNCLPNAGAIESFKMHQRIKKLEKNNDPMWLLPYMD